MAGGFSLWRQRAQRPAPTRSPWASPGCHTLPRSLHPRCPSSHAPPPSPWRPSMPGWTAPTRARCGLEDRLDGWKEGGGIVNWIRTSPFFIVSSLLWYLPGAAADCLGSVSSAAAGLRERRGGERGRAAPVRRLTGIQTLPPPAERLEQLHHSEQSHQAWCSPAERPKICNSLIGLSRTCTMHNKLMSLKWDKKKKNCLGGWSHIYLCDLSKSAFLHFRPLSAVCAVMCASLCVSACVQRSTLMLDPLYRGRCTGQSDSSPRKRAPSIRWSKSILESIWKKKTHIWTHLEHFNHQSSTMLKQKNIHLSSYIVV